MQVAIRIQPQPIDPKVAERLDKRLTKAKSILVLDHPFIGSIALGMPFVLDNSIPTAATNGKVVKFNPSFIDPMTDEELLFLSAHECFHPMFEHNFRRGSRDKYKWNCAGDYVINHHLVAENIGSMPKGGLYDEDIYTKGGGTAEGVYKILPDKQGDGPGEGPCDGPDGPGGGYGGEGEPFDDCQDATGSPAEVSQQAAEWSIKVAQAAQAAKMMGKLSANMERLVGALLKPKVNWREVMRRFMERAKDDTRSWSRPNRRFIPYDMYLPSVSGEAMGEVVFAVDCSGSISEQELNQFASEITVVKEDLRPKKIHVVYFDSSVCHYESYEQHDELDIKPHGGGGTRFSPVFRYIDQHDIQPVAIVFLTDLYCSDFGPAPSAPVLWVSTSDERDVPFGEVVKMEE